MTDKEIIHRIRQEIEKLYVTFKDRIPEETLDEITDGFEWIITDYYESK